jgi:hypothetical protein
MDVLHKKSYKNHLLASVDLIFIIELIIINNLAYA